MQPDHAVNQTALICRPGKKVTRQDGTKLLLNVTVQGSVGPVHVVMLGQNTVSDLIKAALEVYTREKRRPLLLMNDANCFELHYSPFSLDCLKLEEKLINLASRNFFMCQKPSGKRKVTGCNQVTMTSETPFPLIKLMDILL